MTTTPFNNLIALASNDEWTIQWMNRSSELGQIGAKAADPLPPPTAGADLIDSWDMSLEELQAATFIQTHTMCRFMGNSGLHEKLDAAITGAGNGGLDILSLSLIGWACGSLATGTDGFLVALVDGIGDKFTEKSDWVKALNAITCFHGYYFIRKFPTGFEDDADSTTPDSTPDPE